MSRIGKRPVAMPSGVSAEVEGQTLTVKGPKGTLSMPLLDDLVKYEVGEGEIRVTPVTNAQRNRAAWGMDVKFDKIAGGTKVTLNYRAAGFANANADKMAPLVDSVLADQVKRFRTFAARGGGK